MAAFTASLATNKSLHSLSLAGCQISDLFLSNVAIGLFNNCTLENIDLSRNEIGESGIRAINRALKVEVNSRKITNLNLASNGISDSESNAITGLLSTNAGLSTLNLANNVFTTVMVKELFLCCQSNTQIIQLHIGGNCVDEITKLKLRQ